MPRNYWRIPVEAFDAFWPNAATSRFLTPTPRPSNTHMSKHPQQGAKEGELITFNVQRSTLNVQRGSAAAPVLTETITWIPVKQALPEQWATVLGWDGEDITKVYRFGEEWHFHAGGRCAAPFAWAEMPGGPRL